MYDEYIILAFMDGIPMKKIKTLSIAVLLLFVLLSCSLTNILNNANTSSEDNQAAIDRAVAETMAAETQNSAPPARDNPPADVPDTVQFTPTVTLTATSQVPMVSVSMDTNCRFGPGSVYDLMGGLLVGQNAEVIGRNAISDYWVIRLPSNPSVTCWIWGQYATVVGNTSALPIIEPPPTPTPTRTPTRTLPPPAAAPVLTIVNNSGSSIFYVYFSLSTSSTWGSDQLGASTIPAGSSFSWTVSPGTYDIKLEDSGHNVLRSWFNVVINSNVTLTYP